MAVDRKQLAELRDLAAGRSEASLWPTCLMCCERKAIEHGHPCWVPVEAYEVVRQKLSHTSMLDRFVPGRVQRLRSLPRERVTVVARCSHGRETAGDEQRATFDVPVWWGESHVKAAVQQCCFFGPAQYRTHTLVVEIT